MTERVQAYAATAGDLLALTKPRLSGLVIATTAGGMWLAHGAMLSPSAVVTLLSIAAIVGAANALNCFIERDSDRFMERTQNRPLPAGRMEPSVALWFGISLAAVALPALAVGSNWLTAALGALAFGSYVFVYTPLKSRSAWAMVVGAIPGALPPLMGWTAVTNRIDPPGLVLFGILFFWQLAHFLAIGLFRQNEYAAAGLKIFALERGEAASRSHILFYVTALVPVTLCLYPLHAAGQLYLVGAAVLGVGFWAFAVFGFARRLSKSWGRQMFRASLLYLSGLFVFLAIDAHPPGL